MNARAQTLLTGLLLLGLGTCVQAVAQVSGDPEKGKAFFQQSCALCHADTLGPGNTEISRQGPSLVGVFGRHAASGTNFNYTQALKNSGLTWDADSLNRFLANPSALVPGTTMPIPLPDAANRANVIAYLSTLKLAANVHPAAPAAPSSAGDSGDWHHAAPGVKHFITVFDLPAPYSTVSSGNPPRVVKQPADAQLAVPPGFTVKLFASGLWNR